jgi:hypothetical protein
VLLPARHTHAPPALTAPDAAVTTMQQQRAAVRGGAHSASASKEGRGAHVDTPGAAGHNAPLNRELAMRPHGHSSLLFARFSGSQSVVGALGKSPFSCASDRDLTYRRWF